MDDKQTPMDPAEVVELPPQHPVHPQPQNYYGTSVPEKPKKDHTAQVIVLGLLVILLGTMLVVIGLMQLRITYEDGHLRIRIAEKAPVTAGRDYVTLTPQESVVPDTRPGTEQTPSASMEIEDAPPDGTLSVQGIYAAVSPSVVCIQSQGYSGTVTGTGVVMSEDGYILTAAELVSGAASVTVTFSDGTSAAAESIATDSATGICVILADATGLTPAQFASPDTLAVGDTVYSIANPYGSQIRNVFSDGIISTISTDATVEGSNMTLLQTSAVSDEAGNGCPVINNCGQVVAITTSVGTLLTNDGSDPHLGISTPTLKQIVDTLLREETTPSLWLGIQVGVIPDDYRIYFSYPGCLWVTKVGSGTYADGMLYAHDVLTAVDGIEVTTVEDYRAALARHSAGDSVILTIYRAGRWYSATLPLVAG